MKGSGCRETKFTEHDGLGQAPRRPRPKNNYRGQENLSQDDSTTWGRVVHDILARRTRGMDRLLEATR